MSHQVKDIIKLMEDIAPTHLAEPWDNVGLLVGSEQASVDKIMVTLDVTDDVIKQAVYGKVDLIISHHPVLFQAIKEINDTTKTGSTLLQLIHSGISVYSAHTNFDKAKGGTDDTLAELLELRNISPLKLGLSTENIAAQLDVSSSNIDSETSSGFGSLGRIGQLAEPLCLEEYLKRIMKALGTDSVDFIGDPALKIQVVTSCAGAGGDFIEEAQKAGADLFVTGEAKYHEQLPVLEGNMALAVFGHYATEYPAVLSLKRRLQNIIHALQWKVDVISPQDYRSCFRRLQE